MAKGGNNGQAELNGAEVKALARLEEKGLEIQKLQSELQGDTQMLARLIEGRLELEEGALGSTHQLDGTKVVEADASAGANLSAVE